MAKYILALDQGTSSTKAIAFDSKGNEIAFSQKDFTQLFPRRAWVEQNPLEIFSTAEFVLNDLALQLKAIDPDFSIVALGITNQRETTIVWDVNTGRPVCNAIVWQDRRTAEYCDSLKGNGEEQLIKSKTGLLPDAYFSATKIRWILQNVPGAMEKAKAGNLRFGTVDTWLIWKLTKGQSYVSDVTNASRTMLLNISSLKWDEDLLQLFDIPASMLPRICDSSEIVGEIELLGQKVPIAGVIGDQQAALFGQMCVEEGAVKNTYGTGCFLLMNCGNKFVQSRNRLLTTIAWKIGDRVDYALEGSIFVGGAAVQWLRDGLGIIKSSDEVEALAKSVSDNGGVYFVPSLTGLGAPYWDQSARGIICGLTRGATAAHIARAALEGIAFQVHDVVTAMEKDAGLLISELKVDGGASCNNFLMQFQADILGTEVIRSQILETTALGAAYMAGLGVGLWSDIDELKRLWKGSKRFSCKISDARAAEAKAAWQAAIKKAQA